MSLLAVYNKNQKELQGDPQKTEQLSSHINFALERWNLKHMADITLTLFPTFRDNCQFSTNLPEIPRMLY